MPPMRRLIATFALLLCATATLGRHPDLRLQGRARLSARHLGLYRRPVLQGRLPVREHRRDRASRACARCSWRRGKVLQRHDVPSQYFGEGIVDWKNRLIQLTWKSGTGFVYDLDGFTLQPHVQLPRRGLGTDPRQPSTCT